MTDLTVLSDFALVRLDNGYYEDKIITKSGFWLHLSEAYLSNPNLHVTCTGTLMAVPSVIKKQTDKNSMDALRATLFREEIGFPDYSKDTLDSMRGRHDELYNHVYTDSVQIELQKGDKVYFFHDGISPDDKLEDFYKIKYHHIICAERNGEIIMNAAYCLLEQHYDTIQSDLIIIPNNKVKANKGIVKHIGSPLKGFDQICEKGDLVMYERNYDYALKINGTEYLVTPQYKILAVLN